MKYLNVNDYITLYEFPLAITLICLNFSLETLEREPKSNQKVGFVFLKSLELEKAISDYWKGDLMVEPKLFWSKSRELKSRIRSEVDYSSDK